MSSYQAVTRTVIMFGTIVVGAMAWQVYGPPAEQLAPIVNRVVEMAQEAIDRDPPAEMPESLPLAAPRLTAIDAPPILPLPPGALLRVDAEVAPAGYAQPLASPTASPPAPSVVVEELLERLQKWGAKDAEVKPWGASGQTYRCQCRIAPVENPALERHFDAIASEPRMAVEQVLAEVERWRQGQENH